jgi:CDP-paratose 2-epimerase
MRILITGICGFAGSTVAQAWLDAEPGISICGLDNLARQGSEVNRLPLKRRGIALFHGDIRMASDIDALPACDWVVDAAADPGVLSGIAGASSRQLAEHNLLGTINVLEYCKRHRAGLVMLSTSRVYSLAPLAALSVERSGSNFRLAAEQALPTGLTADGVTEAFSTDPPLSLYGSTKRASEILALEYGAAFEFPVWIDRCGVLAGAGQFGRADQGIVSYWLHAWRQRRPLTYIGFGGAGHQVRDCLHPRDLVPLLRKQTAAGAAAPARVFNIGGGAANAFSLAGLSAWCEARWGSRPVQSEPAARRFDVPGLIMDSSLARSVWGWQPQTPFAEVLEEIAGHAERHPNWLDLSGHP